MAIPSLHDFLRRMIGGEGKKKSAFASEHEAYEFVQKVYKDTGGVSPELRNAFLFYLKNIHDDCPKGSGPRSA